MRSIQNKTAQLEFLKEVECVRNTLNCPQQVLKDVGIGDSLRRDIACNKQSMFKT